MASIEFSVEEANATLQLIDLAVKSGGLNVAEAAVVITNKFKSAFPVEKKEEEPKEESNQE